MSIVEYMRQKAVSNLFSMNGFTNSFAQWVAPIQNAIGSNPPFHDLLDLGDSLGSIFKTTGVAGRSQSAVSGGGSCWEGLVCWYLNLCLVGSRAVVIKHAKSLIPNCIAQAIRVNYGNFTSNTESDLIAIIFPQAPDVTKDISGISQTKGFNYRSYVDTLCSRHFSDLEVGIIQCKTNWNDNSQIPMLWEIVYSSIGFANRNITIGTSAYSMRNFRKFFYSFVTVPTNKRVKYKAESVAVQRVFNLSGGNYWGQPSSSGVAFSIKEIFNKNFTSSYINGSQNNDVNSELQKNTTNNNVNLKYFRINL